MKRLVSILLAFALASCLGIEPSEGKTKGECQSINQAEPRPHSISVLEFGAVGDGKTLNTLAFQNAIFYLRSFADKGGAQLYVPAGRWLISSINLTSHLTIFLEKDATILGSQVSFHRLLSTLKSRCTILPQKNKFDTPGWNAEDYTHWDVVEALPSYGRDVEVSGGRYRSLITGNNLTDIVLTGNNGTIDGQGSFWWELFDGHHLNYSRPHLVELVGSSDIVVSNLTFLNAPAWHIHPAYCSNVLVQNITVYSPPESPYTSGIVPDSSEYVCIENSNFSLGYDAIALKSGWDEYGIAYGKPTSNVHIQDVCLQSFTGSGMAIGSEMSGGISNILLEHLKLHDSFIGIDIKTSRGRGGYIEDIQISDVIMENVHLGIRANGHCDSHPDDKFDPSAFPVVSGITIKDVVGTNITIAGNFTGISGHPFTSICMSNISFSAPGQPSESWVCSNVSGFSDNVSPEPCPDLQSSSSSTCYILTLSSHRLATV